MIINDHIRDEKLQYDINSEAAKISALSSGKIHKYKCLTGEDILPSNQQQVIGQAKFTYFPLEKAFEKEISIEDQGQKQVEALENLKPTEQTKVITFNSDDDDDDDDDDGGDDNDKSLNTKGTYNKLFEEKFNEIQKISKEIDYKNLIYNFKAKASGSINFRN